MSENSNEKFEPHSDEDLATILEAQLLAMRGFPARSVGAPLAASTMTLDTRPAAVSAAMPLMFSTAEMARLMSPPPVSTSDSVLVDHAIVEEPVVEEPVVEEPVVDEPVVDEPVVDEVAPERSPRRAASTMGNQLPDLPVFVRKSFDDLISGS